jgi:predicted RND superfamily exporter protein
MQQRTFFARRALIILVLVFFLVPFALQGARRALETMKNDVKDWLPKDFRETADLDWFRQHFISDQFVVVSWDGCHGDESDERYHQFIRKLSPEVPPSQAQPHYEARGAAGAIAAVRLTAHQAGTAEVDVPAASSPSSNRGRNRETSEGAVKGPNSHEFGHPVSDSAYQATRSLERPEFIGDQLGLYTAPTDYLNWGGLNEKWLKGWAHHQADRGDEAWYYISPAGDLYRWTGGDAPLAQLWNALEGFFFPERVAERPPHLAGQRIRSFGPVDGPWYYANPKRLRAQLFTTLTTGPDVLRSLTREGGELEQDPAEAQRRLSGALIGRDGKLTCLMLTLSEVAKRNLHLVVGRGILGKPRGILHEFAQDCGISYEQFHLGGPPVDNVAIDEEGSTTLVRLIALCALLGIGLSYLCFRSASATLMVALLGGISAVVSVATVYWLGSSMDAIMMSMPAMVYVLALSGAAHILNYYHEALEDQGHAGAPERALRHGWKAAVLCNVTNAIGLLSLYTSELSPIRRFGLFSALGVMATLVVMFTYLPACLELWPQKVRQRPEPGQERPSWWDTSLRAFWQRVGAFIVRNHWAVNGVCTVVIVFLCLGVIKMQTSVNMLKMFHPQAKIIRDYHWLEANLGELVPMEIVLRIPSRSLATSAAEAETRDGAATGFDPESQLQLSFLERVELTHRVQQALEEEFGHTGQNIVGRALTAATFVRPLPKAKGDTRSFVVRSATSRRLEAHRGQFLHSDYLRVDQADQAELWRISLRVCGTKGVDYGTFVKDLKYVVEPVLKAQQEREQILRQIAARRPDQRIAGARVLLLGMPAEVVTKTAAEDQEAPEDATPGRLAAGTSDVVSAEVSPQKQTRLFSRTLADLLTISRVRLKTYAPQKNTLPDNWSDVLASQDCVVLVSDEGYDLDAIRQHAPLVVDARNHRVIAEDSATATHATTSPDLTAVYTGIVPIVYKAQRSLLDSLIQSSLWSFLTITPLLMIIARSFGAGLVSMLPNVLPVVMVFGGMGWLAIDVDVGSMMCASIALGVAVDDTIHYLNWFREELNRLGDRKAAILAAYSHCATPACQAAVMSGLGLSIFAMSTFTPTQRFGYLMLTILWMGVVAELIYFPALLAGPLGAFFKPRKPSAAPDEPPPTDHLCRGGFRRSERRGSAATQISWRS